MYPIILFLVFAAIDWYGLQKTGDLITMRNINTGYWVLSMICLCTSVFMLIYAFTNNHLEAIKTPVFAFLFCYSYLFYAVSVKAGQRCPIPFTWDRYIEFYNRESKRVIESHNVTDLSTEDANKIIYAFMRKNSGNEFAYRTIMKPN